MDHIVQEYCRLGIAKSTTRSYNSALKRFYQFCTKFSIDYPFPVSESLLCYYVAFLAQSGLAPSSIRSYLAAVRHMQVTCIMGYPEPRETSSLPRLKLVINGIARKRLDGGQSPSKPRLPIMASILKQLYKVWLARHLDLNTRMIWAACSACFFGFFRAGEITVPSKTAFRPSQHLTWSDVKPDSTSAPSMIKIFLKVSKCDQFGKGVEIFIGRTNSTICPVAAILSYMVARGPSAGPFFQFADGSPLTKARFIGEVRSALALAGLDPSSYSGHSFRIGAATSATQAGLEDSTIKALGRWSSTAFLTYLRTPKQHLASFTCKLSE